MIGSNQLDFAKDSMKEEFIKKVEKMFGPVAMSFKTRYASEVNQRSTFYIFKPSKNFPCYTIVSYGLSTHKYNLSAEAKSLGGTPYNEFIMFLPPTWKFDSHSLKEDEYFWPLDFIDLTMCEKTKGDFDLSPGQTKIYFSNYRPFAENTDLGAGIILSTKGILPNNIIRLKTGFLFKSVQLLLLMPVRTEEYIYAFNSTQYEHLEFQKRLKEAGYNHIPVLKRENLFPEINLAKYKEEQGIPYTDDKAAKILEKHMINHLGRILDQFRPDFGPIVNVAVDVLDSAPYFSTIYSRGMSDRKMNIPKELDSLNPYRELVFFIHEEEGIRQDYNWVDKILSQTILEMHESNDYLIDGSLVLNDENYTPYEGCNFVGGILLDPTFDENLFNINIREGKSIDFLMFVPLYREEVELVLEKGMGELMKRFSEYELDIFVDKNRINVCK